MDLEAPAWSAATAAAVSWLVKALYNVLQKRLDKHARQYESLTKEVGILVNKTVRLETDLQHIVEDLAEIKKEIRERR